MECWKFFVADLDIYVLDYKSDASLIGVKGFPALFQLISNVTTVMLASGACGSGVRAAILDTTSPDSPESVAVFQAAADRKPIL